MWIRKLLSLLLCAAMVITMLPATVLAEGEETVSEGLCKHHTEHTGDCGYRAAQAGIPCDKDCTDTDGDGVTDHVSDCAYTPAVEGQPCAYQCKICSGQQEPVCACTVKCSEDTCNGECPICASDLTGCVGEARQSKSTDTCTCTVRCAGDERNAECLVCAANISACTAEAQPESEEPVPEGLCRHHTVHTGDCGYRAAQAEIPCDKACTDTDGDGVTDHVSDCAYTPAVEGQPCAYVCNICPVQALIDALPGADSITLDNAEAVGAKLDEIDETAMLMTDDELDALDFTKYDAVRARLNELSGQTGPEPSAVLTTVSVDYLDCDSNGQNWQTKTCTSATVVESGTTTWSTGWYVVNSNATISTRITVSGEVHLILADGNKLTASEGITVSSGNSLAIYGQTNGTGTLTATGIAAAGIGGGYESGGNGGTVTINGGTITATSSFCAAGIGGGLSSTDGNYGGTVTINGGTVTATGGQYAAGIGGGAGGIDAGWYTGGRGATVTINGGTVIANSKKVNGFQAPGIGGGMGNTTGGEGGSLTVNGGYVVASGIGGAASKNGNSPGASGTFSVYGNSVVVSDYIKDSANTSGWSGIVFIGDSGAVYGSAVTPEEDFTIDSNMSLLIPTGSALNISGINAVNNGSVYVDGTLNGTFSGSGSLYYPLTVTGGTASPVTVNNSKTYGKAGETITLTGTDVPVGQAVFDWKVSGAAVTVVNNVFTMPASELTVSASGYVNAPTYTVTIPATVELGKSATISASGVNMVSGSQLVVTLSGTSDTGNAFMLTNEEHVKLSYTITRASQGTGGIGISGGSVSASGGNTAVTVGSPVLTVAGGTANASGSTELQFNTPTTAAKYSGKYEGTVTFTVAVQNGDGA